MSFDGKIAVVTGAASGIGAAVTRALQQRGATVIATDVDEAAVARVAAECGAEHAQLDVTRSSDFATLVHEVAARHGRVDLVFNNAGIGVGGELGAISEADFRQVVEVNLFGVLNGVRAGYELMRRQGSGHLVNVASIAGLVPYPLALPYTTSKHAVVGLSLGLRAEAAAYGVKVSVVCPGAIETPIWTRSPLRGEGNREQALDWVRKSWMPADACAHRLLAGVAKNRAIIPITREAWGLWLLQRVSPALSLRLHQALVKKLKARTHPEARHALS